MINWIRSWKLGKNLTNNVRTGSKKIKKNLMFSTSTTLFYLLVSCKFLTKIGTTLPFCQFSNKRQKTEMNKS
jgi:hypothetical protein